MSIDPGELRDRIALVDWVRELKRILKYNDVQTLTDKPDPKRRSSRKAVRTLLGNLRTAERGKHSGVRDPEEIRKVVFNAVDVIVDDKVTQSETGKNRLQALASFRKELVRQFAAQAGGRKPLPPEWETEIENMALALRKEEMSGIVTGCKLPDRCNDQGELEEALSKQMDTLSVALGQFVDCKPDRRSEHYGELYTKLQQLVNDATREDREPRIDVSEAVKALRAGLSRSVVDPMSHAPDVSTPEKLVLGKLGSILDKIEQQASLTAKVGKVPAFKDFDTGQLWRLFIDGRRQHDRPNGDFAFDDPVPERGRAGEIGYMAGCMKAFGVMLDRLDDPLDADLLEDLHSAAVGSVVDDADPPTHDIPLTGGPMELGYATTMRAGFPIAMATLGEKDNGDGNFTPEGLAELMQRVKAEILEVPEEERGGFLPTFQIFTSKGRLAVHFKTGEPVQLREGEWIERIHNTSNAKARREKAGAFIEQFHETLRKLDNTGAKKLGGEQKLAEAKLRAIIRCVQDIEVLHAFADGNCRTMTCVLNKLLLQNGFPPVILLNPNRLDGLSVDQLLVEIRKGWETFDSYCD